MKLSAFVAGALPIVLMSVSVSAQNPDPAAGTPAAGQALTNPTINGTTVFGRVRFGVYEPGTLLNPRVLAVTDVLTNGTKGPYSTAYFDTQLRQTDYSFATGVTTLNVHTSYGWHGIPAMGTGGPMNVVLDVDGSGSAKNEPALRVERANVNIGAGYAQTTGPVGRIWFADDQLLGPVGVQPATLNGPVMLLNNSYDGSPSDSPSAATWLATIPAAGAEESRFEHDTYPVDVGLGIVGFSKANGAEGVGFTTGLQIGGNGSPWNESHSIVGTGANISQYTARGIYVHAPTGSAVADIEAPSFSPTPTTVDRLPPCTMANQGRLAYVTDSRVNAWGEPVRGGGSHPVGVQCNGKAWTVTSK